MKLVQKKINKFLKSKKGRIVGVGDIFDHQRSSIVGETQQQYLERTKKYWSKIGDFVVGNHDAILLRENKDRLNVHEIYRKGPVLALHGHQLVFSFRQAQIIKYEQKWKVDRSESSLFWDVEEWFCSTFNKYFNLKGKKAYSQALSVIQEVDKAGLLDEKTRIIITGHTHLPFDTKVLFKGKKYRVVNCGSSLHGKRFNPVYIKEIKKWFVSDLHIGTKKSLLN